MWKLLWKEWHEQSWKLAFGCIVLTSLALIGLHARIVADETMIMWVCLLGITLLPVISSTGLIPAERAEGSFESLLAMPIRLRRILAAKMVIGLLLCIGPMLLAAAASLLISGGREMYSMAIIDLYGRSMLVSMFLFMWMVALTARLPSEARAGLVAVGILICWMLATVGLSSPGVPTIFLATSPFSFIRGWASEQGNSPFATALVLQLLIVAGLWFFSVKALKNPGGDSV